MLTLTYNEKSVQDQLRRNVQDLAGAFASYDCFSEEQRTEHLCLQYKAKITGIASHLEALSENDDGLKDARVLERFYRRFSRLDDFDPRYGSEYSTKWNVRPDVQAKINQKIIDLEEKLGINDSPESRFVLLQACKLLAGKDVDKFVLRKVWSSARTLEEIAKELGRDFDVIDMPYNANINGEPYFYREEARVRLKRKDFEVYFLSELRKKVIKSVKKRIGNVAIKGGIYEIYNSLNIKIKNYIKGYELENISDESLEMFLQTLGKTAFEGLLFNNLFNKCRRTKIDLKADKNIDALFHKQNGLYGRDLKIDGDGVWRLDNASGISAGRDLNASGDGDDRLYGARGISAGRDLKIDGDGDGRLYQAIGISAGRDLNANGKGNERFREAKSFTINGKYFNKIPNKLMRKLFYKRYFK